MDEVSKVCRMLTGAAGVGDGWAELLTASPENRSSPAVGGAETVFAVTGG